MRLLNRKKDKTRYPAFYAFTLIEITLAIGIVAIGMAGIMALFPIGFNATRDAIGDNYSSETADQFLHVIAQQCLMYKGDGAAVDGWGKWITGDDAAGNSSGVTIPSSGTMTDTYKTDAKKPDLASSSMRLFGDTDADGHDDFGMYYAAQTENGTTKKPGMYYVESRSGSIVDFSGMMAIWQEDIKYDKNNSGSLNASIPKKNAIRLCVEVSWPYGKPYDKREKKYFAYELFNPVKR